jgi:hypothetical protein
MAEAESTTAVVPLQTPLNVTALAKRFGVARTTIQRRLKKGWVPSQRRKPRAALPAAPAAALRSTNAASNRIVTLAALTAALALATCSAAFSIYGLTAIFAGAFWAVVGMGAAFEIGKLSAVAHLGRDLGGRALRCSLLALVGAFMVLNSIGVYGFLSRARIAHTVTAAAQVNGKAADVKARIEVQQSVVTDLDRRIAQLDGMVQAATKRGYTKTAMRLVNDQAARRVDLERQREESADRLAQLEVQQANVTSERKQADADLGPVRYLATLLGSTDEATMRWFILAVALLLNPAAVLLLLAATSRSSRSSAPE